MPCTPIPKMVHEHDGESCFSGRSKACKSCAVLIEGPALREPLKVGVRIRGTLGDIDSKNTLNKVSFQRARMWCQTAL